MGLTSEDEGACFNIEKMLGAVLHKKSFKKVRNILLGKEWRRSG